MEPFDARDASARWAVQHLQPTGAPFRFTNDRLEFLAKDYSAAMTDLLSYTEFTGLFFKILRRDTKRKVSSHLCQGGDSASTVAKRLARAEARVNTSSAAPSQETPSEGRKAVSRGPKNSRASVGCQCVAEVRTYTTIRDVDKHGGTEEAKAFAALSSGQYKFSVVVCISLSHTHDAHEPRYLNRCVRSIVVVRVSNHVLQASGESTAERFDH